MSRKKNDRKAGGRSGKGFAHAGAMMRPTVREIGSARGFAEADVLVRWDEIVGAEHAGKCRPVSVRYGQNRAIGATLTVHADSGRAPEVEHLGPRIVARVNQFYGYQAVSRMKVTQSGGYAPGFAEPKTPFEGPADGSSDVPTTADQSQAEKMTESIESPGLRSALARMGGHVLARARTERTRDS